MSKKNARQESIEVLAQDLSEKTKVEVHIEPIPFKYDELLAEHKTKSGMIRFLAANGVTRGRIAKFMGIKYQFVRNVLVQPVKKTA